MRAGQVLPLAGFAPNGAKTFACARHYKHLAPLERERIPPLHLKVEFPFTFTIYHSPFTVHRLPFTLFTLSQFACRGVPH